MKALLDRIQFIKVNRSLLFVPLSFFFLPLSIVPTYFDRNAPINFILLSIVGVALTVQLFNRQQLFLDRKIFFAVVTLVIICFISFALNNGKINMLTGDSGRFTGLISLFALILIALNYSQFEISSLQNHIRWILLGIFLVDLAGFLQYLNLVKLPTGAGIGSTLGNSDFFSAWLGTSLPLIFLLKLTDKTATRVVQIAFTVFTIFMLSVIDVKQGFIDLIIFAGFILVWRFKSKIKDLHWGPRFWTVIISFFTIIWFELIFLLPMAKIKIPFFTDDIQVTIRSHFWNAGVQMFFHRPFFGVGADNYGNYYEKYRTLDSFKLTEFVLSNDAHSAMVQTFATLGIFAVLLFTLLWILLIKAWVKIIFELPQYRIEFLLIGIYFFLFATNSMISPITLPHKFIFWALAGVTFGTAAKLNNLELPKFEINILKPFIALLAVMVAFVSINFFLAQFNFINAINTYKKNPNAISYNYNPYLPCVIYFPAQAELAAAGGKNSRINTAAQQIKNQQRCFAAQMYLAELAVTNKDWRSAKILVNNVLEIAPARREVLSLAAIYAVKADDKQLQKRLISQGELLGIINATGSVPQSLPKLK